MRMRTAFFRVARNRYRDFERNRCAISPRFATQIACNTKNRVAARANAQLHTHAIRYAKMQVRRTCILRMQLSRMRNAFSLARFFARARKTRENCVHFVNASFRVPRKRFPRTQKSPIVCWRSRKLASLAIRARTPHKLRAAIFATRMGFRLHTLLRKVHSDSNSLREFKSHAKTYVVLGD